MIRRAGSDDRPAARCRRTIFALLRRPRTVPASESCAGAAVAPYPHRLVEPVRLPDGTRLVLRPIRPEDAEREQRFVRELSAETRRLRFMHAITELSPEMLERFTRIDYDREMALVALLERGPEPRQLGVARYVIDPGGASAKFAVVVGDAAQGRGIGSCLMRALIRAARRHRLAMLGGEVLAENRPMLRLMTRLGFDVVRNPDDFGTVRVLARALSVVPARALSDAVVAIARPVARRAQEHRPPPRATAPGRRSRPRCSRCAGTRATPAPRAG